MNWRNDNSTMNQAQQCKLHCETSMLCLNEKADYSQLKKNFSSSFMISGNQKTQAFRKILNEKSYVSPSVTEQLLIKNIFLICYKTASL